jgi:hypothetical protein
MGDAGALGAVTLHSAVVTVFSFREEVAWGGIQKTKSVDVVLPQVSFVHRATHKVHSGVWMKGVTQSQHVSKLVSGDSLQVLKVPLPIYGHFAPGVAFIEHDIAGGAAIGQSPISPLKAEIRIETEKDRSGDLFGGRPRVFKGKVRAGNFGPRIKSGLNCCSGFFQREVVAARGVERPLDV